MNSYDVVRDPLEPTETWRVIVDDHFTAKKFSTEAQARTHVLELMLGQATAEFDARRPVRVQREVVFETEDVALVKTSVEHEAFTFTTILGDVFTWDVTRAREMVKSPENVIGLDEIPPQVLAEIGASNEWSQPVVDKADPSEHGIAAPIVALGEVIYILIDGTHRAVNALQTRRPFCAWLLSPDANRSCLVRGRRDLIP